jgi:hypothetical protein
MADLLSRLMGLEQTGFCGRVDAVKVEGQTWGMAPSKDLSAVDIHTDDVGDYNVTEPGWYAVDDAGTVVLGPFESLAQCERAIRDRKQIQESKA